jgi:hypothetical protein
MAVGSSAYGDIRWWLRIDVTILPRMSNGVKSDRLLGEGDGGR